jgi:hypothetical protein
MHPPLVNRLLTGVVTTVLIAGASPAFACSDVYGPFDPTGQLVSTLGGVFPASSPHGIHTRSAPSDFLSISSLAPTLSIWPSRISIPPSRIMASSDISAPTRGRRDPASVTNCDA